MGTSLACEPDIPIRVINQTDQTLAIFINGHSIGDVRPSAEIKNTTVSAVLKEYLIKARNTQGNTIYSRSFTFDQLSRDMNCIVIIPLFSEGVGKQ